MNIHHNSTFKHAKFGRGSVELTSRDGQPLDLAEIGRAVPSIFATEAHGSRSERYSFISTMAILEGLSKEGFQPYSIMQGGSRDEDKRAFTKHLIRLRSQSPVASVTGSTYEVCLLNSHDGTTSNKMFGGFFRFACKNGSIFFDGEATEVRVPHTGDILDRVVEGAYTVVGHAQLAAEHVTNFRRISVTRDEQMAFARAALHLRFDEDQAPVEPMALLNVRRHEDAGNDLWSCFNRVQENTLRGGLRYQHIAENGRTSRRETRPVRSVDGDVRINRALWTLTEEMAKIKAA